MEHRVIWVHGIGDRAAGYSDSWRANFNRYLHLPDESFIEVLWRNILDASTTRGSSTAIELTPAEQVREEDLKREFEAKLQTRSAALQANEGTAPVSAPPADRPVMRGLSLGSVFRMTMASRGYAEDFVRYLASERMRDAVKQPLLRELRGLAGFDGAVSIVSHSWGTVVSHDCLVDLAKELPGLRISSLITMGSPLWLVLHALEDSSGAKPANVGQWVNIHARGDLVGSWLEPAFKVDRDFAVASVADASPHTSYFDPSNEAVQRDLVAPFIRGFAD